MTANPEQSAMEKVRQRWPDAFIVSFGDFVAVAIKAQCEIPHCEACTTISDTKPTKALAWLDAASRLEAEHE